MQSYSKLLNKKTLPNFTRLDETLQNMTEKLYKTPHNATHKYQHLTKLCKKLYTTLQTSAKLHTLAQHSTQQTTLQTQLHTTFTKLLQTLNIKTNSNKKTLQHVYTTFRNFRQCVVTNTTLQIFAKLKSITQRYILQNFTTVKNC